MPDRRWSDADRDRRREWVAALRDGANRLLEPRGWASAADALRDRACVIESGVLTPWADQPDFPTRLGEVSEGLCREPVGDEDEWGVCARERPCPMHDQPKHVCTDEASAFGGYQCSCGQPWLIRADRCMTQPSGDVPAAAGPHPDTPQRCGARFLGHEDGEITCDLPAGHGGFHEETETGFDWGPPHPGTPDGAAGILGRALLDSDGDIWQQHPDGWIGAGILTTAEITDKYGPVREVLLVSPAAGRVLDAARAAAGLGPMHDAEETQAIRRELCAAVEALDADQPAEQYPREQYEVLRQYANQQIEAIRGMEAVDPNVELRRRAERARWARESDITGHDSGVSAGQPAGPRARPDPGPDRCRVIVIYDPQLMTSPEECGNPRPCPWHDRKPEPAPEPDSGTGWDRGNVERIIAMVDAIPQGASGDGDQLRALLADRDQADEGMRRNFDFALRMQRERDTARAELAEVTADRDRAVEALGDAATKGGRLAAEVDRLRGALT